MASPRFIIDEAPIVRTEPLLFDLSIRVLLLRTGEPPVTFQRRLSARFVRKVGNALGAGRR